MSNHLRIPVLELGCLMGLNHHLLNAYQYEAAKRLVSSFETVGLAYVRLDEFEENFVADITNTVIEASKKLFQVSEEHKTLATRHEPGIARGFLARGSESGAAQATELKEAFSYGHSGAESEQEQTIALLAPNNVWPNACNVREPFEKYFDICVEVMQAVSKALSAVLNIQECDAQEIRSGNSISLMRVWRYLPKTAQCDTGSVEHTDWGFCTLIAQDPNSDSALQAYLDGQWVDIRFVTIAAFDLHN